VKKSIKIRIARRERVHDFSGGQTCVSMTSLGRECHADREISL
jgi:hypothetical protein